MIGEQPLTFLPGHDLYDNVGKPGSLKEKLRRMKKTGEAEEFSIFEPVRPEYLDRDLRLSTSWTPRTWRPCLMFPSVGVTVEHFMATPRAVLRQLPRLQPLDPRRLGASPTRTASSPRP